MKKLAPIIMASCFIVLMLLGCGRAVTHAVGITTQSSGREVVYGNERYCDETKNPKGHHFNTDIYTEAQDEKGDLTEATLSLLNDWWDKDPALVGAHATAFSEVFGVDVNADEKDVNIGQRPDVTHLHCLKSSTGDGNYWDACVSAMRQILDQAEVSIVELDSYESAMYMDPDSLEGDKPSVIVGKSDGQSGHALKIVYNGKTLLLRIECGFQPVNVEEYWPLPENPTDTTGEPDTPDGTGNPDDNPGGTGNPETTPELEPKNESAGPQGTGGSTSNPDYGGGANDASSTYTEETAEPASPESYSVPAAPPESDSGGSSGDDGGGSNGNTGETSCEGYDGLAEVQSSAEPEAGDIIENSQPTGTVEDSGY